MLPGREKDDIQSNWIHWLAELYAVQNAPAPMATGNGSQVTTIPCGGAC